MEIYFIIGLLIIVIVMLTIVLLKNNRHDFSSLNEHIALLISKNNVEQMKNMNSYMMDINKLISEKVNNLNETVNNKLDDSFSKSQETFTNIIERMAKIDEAQKKITDISSDIASLEDILTDKKARGIYGEVQLNQILNSVFGSNKALYEEQKKLSNGLICDFILHAPKPLGDIAIDSKFPLENYQRIFSDEGYIKSFKNDIKKHIDDISTKYIITGETSEQAIMFIPAEAIFAYINAYCQDLIIYAQKKRVWITSPTTLISTLTTIQVIVRNMERDKHAKILQDELNKLAIEFDRYHERWKNFSRVVESMYKSASEISITSDKINNRFGEISRVEVANKTIDIDDEKK